MLLTGQQWLRVKSLYEFLCYFDNFSHGFVCQDCSSPSGTSQTFAHAPQKIGKDALFSSFWDEIMKPFFMYNKTTDLIHFPKI